MLVDLKFYEICNTPTFWVYKFTYGKINQAAKELV